MNKSNRFLVLLLTILLLSLWPVGIVKAESIIDGPIQTEDKALLVFQLERKAVNYVTKYINTTYLYSSDDLVSGTLLEYYSDGSPELLNTTLLVCGDSNTAIGLYENMTQFVDVAYYLKYIRTAQGIVRHKFTSNIDVVQSELSETSAVVQIYASVTFQYDGHSEISSCGDNYWIYFSQIGDEWVVVDIESEEMAAYGFYKETFNVAEAIEDFDSTFSIAERRNEEITIDPALSIEEQASTYSITTGRYYDADNAIAYAYTYTTSSYEEDEGNNPSFLNNYFTNYGNVNCQNFASQCVWAGFNGIDHPTYVDQHDDPMDNEGTYQWFGSRYDEYDSTHAWIYVPSFKTYADSSNVASSETGLRSVVDTIENRSELMSKTSSKILGAVLHVNNQNHAIVLTGIGTVNNTSTIFYCANSPMRKECSIDDYNITSKITHLISPTRFVEIYDCTTHTYPVSNTAPEGYAAKCSNCGYILLHVYTDMIKPISVGTTKTITGTTNLLCNNMAIGITTPGGVTTWYDEFTQTDRASVSYTFNQRGLYTIEIGARDVAQNEAGVESTRVCHIFKVRVY